MKRFISIGILILGIFSLYFLFSFLDNSERVSIKSSYCYETVLKQDIFSLMMAYQEYILDIEVVDNSKVYLLLESGEKILYDDGIEKDSSEKLRNASIKNMMEQQYVLGPINKLMPEDYNPGRIRVYPLLKAIYGSNQYEIEQNLVRVRINSNFHRFNSRNSAADQLANSISELNALASNNPKLWSFIYPLGGTYNFRYISKTNRLSPHAFGIAIDFASNKNDYWQWTTRSAGEKRLKSYPYEIVEVMERNYFIWGGKWGQFDILHFEYRPEIIIKALYFTEETEAVWFQNLPVYNIEVSDIVCLIEERLQNFIPPN